MDAQGRSPLGNRELAEQLAYDRNTMRNSLEQQLPKTHHTNHTEGQTGAEDDVQMAEAFLSEELSRVKSISESPVKEIVGGVSRLQPTEIDDDYRLSAIAEE